jgi:chloramphenicol-sensitive protein RarD
VNSSSIQSDNSRAGLLYGITCYTLWGIFPLYFIQLEFAPALEIVAHRIIWSLLLCLALLAVTRRLPEFFAVLRNPRQLGSLAIAAALITCNWLTYVYATNNGQVLQASLGYFINPLLTILLGVVLLREQLRPMQWVAVAIALLAIIVIAVGQGGPPWLALTMALTFGFYGLSKKLAGRSIAPIPSLTIETLLVAPVAIIVLMWITEHGESHFLAHGMSSALLLSSTGIATTIPLIAFAAAARRLPLSMLGMLQYIGPILQFIVAVTVMHEVMSPARWTGFGMIWVALALITVDALHNSRRNVRLRRAVESAAA